MLLDQLRSGAATRLVLIGIEGGDAAGTRPALRARSPRPCARAALFETVENGDRAAVRAAPDGSCSSTAIC